MIPYEICINELCSLDLSRIDLENRLTFLTNSELKEVEQKLKTTPRLIECYAE